MIKVFYLKDFDDTKKGTLASIEAKAFIGLRKKGIVRIARHYDMQPDNISESKTTEPAEPKKVEPEVKQTPKKAKTKKK